MKNIIVTIGPQSINPSILKSLKLAGASSFRINLSHSTNESLDRYYSLISSCNIIPSIDTQGAQLRVESLPDSDSFLLHEQIYLIFGKSTKSNPDSNSQLSRIVFNHPEVSDQINVGDILKIDFNGLIVEVSKTHSSGVFIGTVIASGEVLTNRAVDIQGKSINLAPLTTFDIESLIKAQKLGCREVFASFVSSGDDIRFIRDYLYSDTKLISKIETARGVANAHAIISLSDAILIDRGDLSREISIPSVPVAVNRILELARQQNKSVYIATNVLDSMMSSQIPSRAEISDIYTLLKSGVDGLVLAAEVAIGQNPVSSTALLEYLIRFYDNEQSGLHGIGFVDKPNIDLIGHQLYNWL